jgi:hypothetical protein
MMAMQPPPTSSEDEEDKARLYFEIFDLDGNGTIDHSELQMMLECLLHDYEENLTGEEVYAEALTALRSQLGMANEDVACIEINFEQFKLFYESVLSCTHRSTTVTSRTSRPNTRTRTIAVGPVNVDHEGSGRKEGKGPSSTSTKQSTKKRPDDSSNARKGGAVSGANKGGRRARKTTNTAVVIESRSITGPVAAEDELGDGGARRSKRIRR